MDLNDIQKRFEGMDDARLAQVIKEKADYRPEAYQLALDEWHARNIPMDLVEDMAVSQVEEHQLALIDGAEKLSAAEKVIFLLIPLIGFGDLFSRMFTGNMAALRSRINESLIWSGIGLGLWFLARSLSIFF